MTLGAIIRTLILVHTAARALRYYFRVGVSPSRAIICLQLFNGLEGGTTTGSTERIYALLQPCRAHAAVPMGALIDPDIIIIRHCSSSSILSLPIPSLRWCHGALGKLGSEWKGFHTLI